MKNMPEKGQNMVIHPKSISISKRGIRNFYLMENQDHIFIDEREHYRLYGIYDGHGKYGRMMAEKSAEKVSEKFTHYLERSSRGTN